jgi:hypothetical protein
MAHHYVPACEGGSGPKKIRAQQKKNSEATRKKKTSPIFHACGPLSMELDTFHTKVSWSKPEAPMLIAAVLVTAQQQSRNARFSRLRRPLYDWLKFNPVMRSTPSHDHISETLGFFSWGF